ncbi:MAG: hypothetical protein K6E30_08840, partial [Lachnospiraceae bacterium]|nr:hypothetical protein [Lachnospiraceae bacterium]
MDAKDILLAAGGIRDEDILDAEAAAGLWEERAPGRKADTKRKAVHRAFLILLPAAAGFVLLIGVLGTVRMGSGRKGSEDTAFSAAAEEARSQACNAEAGTDAALAAGALTPEEALEEKNETGDNETPGTEGAAEETEAAAYAGEAG